jgi:FAD/FMN-containing dehydrogenase
MEEKVLNELKAIVGEENVLKGTAGTQRFLRPGWETPSLVTVRPQKDEELQKIVDLARDNQTGIITANDRYLLEEDLDKEGIFLDFERMNEIEVIDGYTLMAHVQRGVTWDQLNEALKTHGMKAAAPVAANSISVAESHTARVVGKAASKYWDFPASNLRLVLANGRIHRTGTHGFSDESDGRNEGGPNLSNWFFGADDVLGIMTRASIMLWPVRESRTCLVYAFEDVDEMLNVMKNVPRTELGVEYVGMNRVSLANLLGGAPKDYPAWSLTIGFDGRAKRVEHNKDRVGKLMQKFACRQEDRLVAPMTEQLDLPWMEASDYHTGFYTLFSNSRGLEAEVDKAAAAAGLSPEKVGKIYSSFDHGRAVYAVYDWFSDDPAHASAIDALNLSLADLGAFFDRSHGDLGRKIYTSIPNHLPVLKHIKKMLDPENVMNPGRIIKDEDAEWQPLQTGDGEIGLTVSNIKEVKSKLAEKVGEQWVSNNPVDLSAYGRDFTIFSGERPNIAVLPRTTEEVQSVIKIAYEHGIPLVPLSTGFNHGGLTISRKGGILVDLKRMNELMSFDDEAMTVAIGPGIRMRSLWWESVNHRAYEDFHLKPILPLTLGSVSLLSNYVSRGGAGSLFKYGLNPELTAGMTWVLPNGEVLKVGPSAVPNVGNLPLHFTPGPDLCGMFFNADGMLGVCTELTAKLYPEKDNAAEFEDYVTAANYDPDFHHAFTQTVKAIHEIGQENITDFIYKAHPGLFALAMVDMFEGVTVKSAIGMAPQHPVSSVVSGYDAEELEFKKEFVSEIYQKHGLMVIDPAMFGPEMAEAQSTDTTKMSLGIKDNTVGAHKGAFQWTACNLRMDKIPEFARRYDKLVQKYWKTSDPTVSVEHAMTGTDIQGPLPFARAGGIEVDFWWDQGNPEEVKRATTMMHKTQQLMLEFGGALFRNMFGSGEYHLPLWGKVSEYLNILKDTRKAFDPANLMHPDVLPSTDDYI